MNSLPPDRTTRFQPPRWLFFPAMAFLMDFAMVAALYAVPLVALRDFHASNTELGLLGAATAAGYALVALLSGRFSDRGPKRAWGICGAAMQCLILTGLVLCRHRGLFFTLAVLQNTFLGLFWAPIMGLMSETTSSHRLSRELGIYNICWSGGAMLGSLASAAALDRLGSPAPFALALAVTVAVLCIVASGPPRKALGGSDAQRSHPLALPLKRLAWLSMGGAFFVASIMIYLFPARAEKALHYTPLQSLSLQGARLLGNMAIFALMGCFSRWHFRRWPYHLIFALLTLSLLTVYYGSGWGVFALGFAATGVASGIAYVLSAYYSMLSPARQGSMLGVHEALISSGSMLGPLFGSMAIHWRGGDLRAPYLWGHLPLLLTWCLCLALLGRLPRAKKSAAPAA